HRAVLHPSRFRTRTPQWRAEGEERSRGEGVRSDPARTAGRDARTGETGCGPRNVHTWERSSRPKNAERSHVGTLRPALATGYETSSRRGAQEELTPD